ncbi:hypothetical protein [Bacillus toyonensis]|uniref:hypothetical protein n=1 Tax=Bacillus toyonensis TaxID=155322 RepID=UPI000BEC8BB0|nr:hypothetical protein [Bacillus toyonensis]PED20382.1 hypothetical protein CON63_10455 [Bacillus toyonensis]PEM94097.1 hypothetical protein CN629_14945 [Bacillus toyonensis]
MANEITPEMKAVMEYVKWPILNLPGVVGVGIGMKEVNNQLFDEPAIRVYVSDISTVPSDIPSVVGELGVCIIESHIRPCVQQDLDKYNELVGGIRVVNPIKGYGTLGAVVQDKNTGELLGLSCYHVVGDQNNSFPYSIWQPDNPPLIAGASPPKDNYIGDVVRVDFPNPNSNQDAAVFTLSAALNQGRSLSQAIIGQNSPDILIDRISATAEPKKGQWVRKRGFMTRTTEGFVIDESLTIQWPSGPPNTYLTDISVITASSTSGNVFCQKGDSGSVVLDKDKPIAVGLLFGESDNGLRGYMSKIKYVESELEVNMVWI